VERDGAPVVVEVAPRPLTATLLVDRFAVYFLVSALMLAVGASVSRLSSRLAPHDLAALVERYFGAFLDEIVEHGGDVNETAGDGLMAIFHEDARAAVDAARAIHRRTAEIGAELAGRFEPLAMHVGINTGPALLGATKIEGSAGTRWTYTASGLTTNIAARLAAQAGDGEIVLSEATQARLDPDVTVEDLGARELKNVDQPMRLFRLRDGG
jgi:class 3 adenylate cyclase